MESDKNNTLSVRFDGKNYPLWRFHLQFYIQGKGLWGFVDGSAVKPADGTQTMELEQWKVNNAKVVSWIIGSMETNIGASMMGLATAKDMWEFLEKVYRRSNLARKFKIENDMFEYRQGERNVQDYYVRFIDLWAEYEMVYTENAAQACCLTALKVINEERKVMHFLMKLRPEYEVVRVSILNRDAVPSIDSVLGELLREETRIKTQATIEGKKATETVYIAKQNMGKQGKGHRDLLKVQCYECEEYGHVASHCKKNIFCVYCKQPGHRVKECVELSQKGNKTSNQKKGNHRVYHAVSGVPRSVPESKVSGESSSTSKSMGRQAPQNSDEIRQLVQSSVSSAISSAFSAIGLTGRNSHLSPTDSNLVENKFMSLSTHSGLSNEDIMSSIFLKLPVKSVLKCKCVCKIWQSIASNPLFCHQHVTLHGLNPNPSAFIFKRSVNNTSSFESVSLTTNYSDHSSSMSKIVSFDYLNPPGNAKLSLLSSCNGLLLFQSSNCSEVRDFYVCNPTTKKFVKLALPNYLTRLARVDASLAFDPCVSPHYKVVFLWRDSGNRYYIAMYSSEMKIWGKVSVPCSLNSVKILEGSGVFCNGKIHWHAFEQETSFYFDVDEGCVKSFRLPPLMPLCQPFHYFGASRGRLHAVMGSHSPDDTFVYEMEENYSRWFVKYRLGFKRKNVFLCYFCEEEDEGSTLLQLDESGQVAVYNLKVKTTDKVCHLNPLFNNHDLSSTFYQICENYQWSQVAYQWIENLSCV